MSVKLAIGVACLAAASAALASREKSSADAAPTLPVLEIVGRFPLPPEQGTRQSTCAQPGRIRSFWPMALHEEWPSTASATVYQ